MLIRQKFYAIHMWTKTYEIPETILAMITRIKKEFIFELSER